MDARMKDDDGMTICPECGKHYFPVLGERPANDDRCIQTIFPNSKPYEREQLLSGLCSDECWKNHMGWYEDD